MSIIWVIFAFGSLAITTQVVKDIEFSGTLDKIRTYLVTWAVMFVLSFGTFALVIGI